ALAHELLGHRGGELRALAPQLVARAPDVRLQLRARAVDQPLRLRAGRADEALLLLRGLLQGLGADRGRLGVGGAQARPGLLLLQPRLGPPGLTLVARLVDWKLAAARLSAGRAHGAL